MEVLHKKSTCMSQDIFILRPISQIVQSNVKLDMINGLISESNVADKQCPYPSLSWFKDKTIAKQLAYFASKHHPLILMAMISLTA